MKKTTVGTASFGNNSGSYLWFTEYDVPTGYNIGVSRMELVNDKRYPDKDEARYMVYTYGMSIYFVAKGYGMVYTPKGNEEAREGDLFVFQQNEPHAWQGNLQLCVVHTPGWDKSQLKYSDDKGNVIK